MRSRASLAQGFAKGRPGSEDNGDASHAFSTDHPDLNKRSIGENRHRGNQTGLGKIDMVDRIAGPVQGLTGMKVDLYEIACNERKLRRCQMFR